MNTAIEICTVTDYGNRADWLQARRNGLGSSDTAAIFGEGYADQSALTVWQNKVYGDHTEQDSDRLWIGTEIQPALCRIFTRKTGVACTSPGDYAIHSRTDIPWLKASLDAVADHEEFGPIPLELKNVSAFNKCDWEGDIPLKFVVQTQHQMAVTGASHAFLFGLIGGNEPIAHLIERNDAFINVMIEKLSEFWHCVETGTMPVIDGSLGTAKALARLYPLDSGESILLPSEASDWVAAREKASAEIKDAEARKTEAENQLKSVLGTAAIGVLKDGRKVTWKTQNRKGYVVEPTSFRVLRVENNA